MKASYTDKDFGKIILQVNVRAKNVIFRFTPDGLKITLPAGCTQKQFEEILEKNRPILKEKIVRTVPKSIIDESFSLKTNRFSVRIFRTDRRDFYFSRKEEILHIACPMGTDFTHVEVRALLVKGIERFLKADAKFYLPQRLRLLADRFHLSFSEVKINSSKSRWGSCSTQRNINLTFYLMLLPTHLIDYVLLHELTHTLEMNHSPKFWQKLNGITEGKALELRKELKQFKTRI